MKYEPRPLISVIVPVYNGEKYIYSCLESIRRQKYDPLEVIFVDDGSCDHSQNVIKKYRERYAKTMDIVLICQENQGQGSARNTGIENAKGTYLTFLDQDDSLEQGILKKMMRTAREEKADIVACGYRRITKDGKIRQEVRLQQTEWSKYKMITPWSKLYRTEFVMKNHIRFLPVALGEDIYFLIQAYSYRPKMAFREDIGYNWMNNERSVSNTVHKELTKETSLLQLFDMLEALPESKVLRKDRLYEYFLIKTAIWDILYTARSNSYRTVKENSEKIWDWFDCHFHSYMENPYLRLGKPKGETGNIKLLVWGYMKMRQLRGEKLFLRLISKSE